MTRLLSKFLFFGERHSDDYVTIFYRAKISYSVKTMSIYLTNLFQNYSEIRGIILIYSSFKLEKNDVKQM